MMHDRDTISRYLQRWRDMLNSEVDQDARRALRELIDGAEKRLAKLEGRNAEIVTFHASNRTRR